MALYAFDGTNDDDRNLGTDPKSMGEATNVFRFFTAYNANQKQTICDYVPGVGTRFKAVGVAVGGAFGVGWLPRVAETYDALCENVFTRNDTVIDVIGFSRGAAMALDFVSKVATKGLHSKDGKTVVPAPPIRFVGLFDVVDAFGVASLGGPISAFDPIHHLALPSSVQHCFHAMALDERRPSFVNHRVDGAHEAWFRGVHSDIGGSNKNWRLEHVALRWMYYKAMLCQLPITQADIDALDPHPEDKIKPNFFSQVSVVFWRSVRPFDLVHYSVAQHPPLPGEALRAVPDQCPPESPLDEQQRMGPPSVTPAAVVPGQ